VRHLVLGSALCVLAFQAGEVRAQEHENAPVASSDSTGESEVPQVPGLSGFLRGANAGLTISGIHDAVTGWAVLTQPALGYTFNDTFALDVTIPIYNYRLTQSLATNPKPNALLVKERAELGDVVVGLHAQFERRNLQYEATVSATAPTGDELHGLSTGRATFDLSNLFQLNLGHITPDLELGVGDSEELVNRLVTKNYTSLGPLAHFQLGFSVPLLLGSSFQSDVYEALPIGDQKIYQSVTRKGSTTFVVTGHNVSEDNGFINSFDLPLNGHATVSAYYSRSLRQHDDILSFGVTWVLRSSKPEPIPSTP
jgi:hypothetical protein